MTRLSPPAIGTIQQFAQSMDVTAYEAPDGAYSFDFETNGRLSISGAEDDKVVVSLTSRLLFEDMRGFAVLMPLAGYRAEIDEIVHVGLNKAGQGMLGVKTAVNSFNLPFLERAFAVMTESFGRIAR